MKCATHADVETNLTCGRCDTPICPRCLVQTPVGARCRKCAGLRRLPTYQIAPQQYLKAVGAGLGLAIAIGFAWGWLWDIIPFFFISLFLAAGVGYVIGELISLSVNRRRGVGLQVIGGLSVALAYLVSILIFSPDLREHLYGLLMLAVGIFVVVSRLR
jgi:hypothetical protein